MTFFNKRQTWIWPALLNRVNNVNALVCSKCLGSKKIITFIDDEQLVKKILKHLDLWDVKRKPPPCANVEHPPGGARRLKPLSSMMSPHRPARMITSSMPIVRPRGFRRVIRLTCRGVVRPVGSSCHVVARRAKSEAESEA